MKRYFLVHDDDMPTIKERFPGMNFIPLDSHGAPGRAPVGHLWNLVSLAQDDIQPKANWQAFPPLIDSKTTLAQSPIDHELLLDLGLTGEETTMEAAMKLGEIFSAMGVE